MSTPFLVFVFDVVSLVQTAWRCRFALAHGAHTRAAGPARAGLAAGRRQDNHSLTKKKVFKGTVKDRVMLGVVATIEIENLTG